MFDLRSSLFAYSLVEVFCWDNCVFFLVAAGSTGDAFIQNIQEQAILEPTYGQLKDPSGSVVKGGGW